MAHASNDATPAVKPIILLAVCLYVCLLWVAACSTRWRACTSTTLRARDEPSRSTSEYPVGDGTGDKGEGEREGGREGGRHLVHEGVVMSLCECAEITRNKATDLVEVSRSERRRRANPQCVCLYVCMFPRP